MDESLVAPELRPMVRRYPFKLLEYDFGRPLTRLLIRFMPPTRMKGVTIKALKGQPRLRIYRPAARLTEAGLLWIHGGGYVVGAARINDFSCSDICRTLGMTVVSVDYRLAPKHPFPAAAEDCLAAWQWIQQSGPSLGIDPARVVIGGASAGGGLAAGLVQRVRDTGGRQPAAQWLLSPMLDDRTAARRELDDVDHYVWNNRMNRASWRLYLDMEPGSADVPAYAVPARRGDLSGLPPTFIGAGSLDLFYEEDRSYAERLRRQGIAVTFETIPGAPHGFEEWARNSGIARRYLSKAREWLRSTVCTGTAAGPVPQRSVVASALLRG